MNRLTLPARQARRWTRMAAAFFFGFSMAALCFVARAFVQTAGIYTSWLYCGSFVVVGAGISAILYMRYRFRMAICTGTGFLVSILVLHYYDATPAKAFRRLEAAVGYGMTLADVRSAVRREFLERGRFLVPALFESVPSSQMGEEVLFIDSRFGFNMFLSFRNGRVTDKQSNLTPSSDMALPTTMALVAACVCFMCWQSARRISAVKVWTAHGIDARSVAERLQCVRRDYLGEYRTRHQVACQRRDLLASAGLAVRRFPYFRGRAAESSEVPEDERGST